MKVLLERRDVTVAQGCLQVGRVLHNLANVDDVAVQVKREGGSLIWLVYAGLSVLALAQAASGASWSLAAIAAALAVLSKITWDRRLGPSKFELVLSRSGEAVKVHETTSWAEANLVRDAVAMALPR